MKADPIAPDTTILNLIAFPLLEYHKKRVRALPYFLLKCCTGQDSHLISLDPKVQE